MDTSPGAAPLRAAVRVARPGGGHRDVAVAVAPGDGDVTLEHGAVTAGNTRPLLCQLHERVTAVASCGALLACATMGGVRCFAVAAVDADACEATERYRCAALPAPATALAFSPCGRYLAASVAGSPAVSLLYVDGSEGGSGTAVVPLAAVTLSSPSPSPVTGVCWSVPPTYGSLASVDELGVPASHRSEGASAVPMTAPLSAPALRPLVLLVTHAADGGAVAPWAEAPPWEGGGVHFTPLAAPAMPPGTGGSGGGGVPSATAWVRTHLVHDRLHWAWGAGGSGSSAGAAGGDPVALAASRTRPAVKASHSSSSSSSATASSADTSGGTSKEATLITLPPLAEVGGGGSDTEDEGDDGSDVREPAAAAAPAGDTASFPLPRNLIGRTRPPEADEGEAVAMAAPVAAAAVEPVPPPPPPSARVAWPPARPAAWRLSGPVDDPVVRACLGQPPLSLHPSLRPHGHFVTSALLQQLPTPTLRLSLWRLPLTPLQAPTAAAPTGGGSAATLLTTADVDLPALLAAHAAATAGDGARSLAQQPLSGVTSAVVTAAASVAPVRVGGSAPPSLPLPVSLASPTGTGATPSAEPLAPFRAVTGVQPDAVAHAATVRRRRHRSHHAGASSRRSMLLHGGSLSGGSLSPVSSRHLLSTAASDAGGASASSTDDFDARPPSAGSGAPAAGSATEADSRPRRDSLLSRLRPRQQQPASLKSVHDDTASAAADGRPAAPSASTSSSRQLLRQPSSLSSSTSSSSSRVRTRAASALATAAAFDGMDSAGGCGGGDCCCACACCGSDVAGEPAGPPLPPRVPFRSCNRGLCGWARASQPPASSLLTVHVDTAAPARGPGGGARRTTRWEVLLEVDWATGAAQLRRVAPLAGADAAAGTTSAPAPVPAPAAATTTTPHPPPLPHHHPAFLVTCLKLGRPALAAAALSHLAVCVRRAQLWAEALAAEADRRALAAGGGGGAGADIGDGAPPPVTLIEGHFTANPSPSRRLRAVGGSDEGAGDGDVTTAAAATVDDAATAALAAYAADDNAALDTSLAAYAGASDTLDGSGGGVSSSASALRVHVPPLPLHMLLRQPTHAAAAAHTSGGLFGGGATLPSASSSVLAPDPFNGNGGYGDDGNAPTPPSAATDEAAEAAVASDGDAPPPPPPPSPVPPLRLLRAWYTAHPFTDVLRPTPAQLAGADDPPSAAAYPPPLTLSRARWLLGELPSLSLPGLSRGDHLRLLAALEAFLALHGGGSGGSAEAATGGLDAPGLAFLLAWKLWTVHRRCLAPADRPPALELADVLLGAASECQDALLRLVLPPPEAAAGGTTASVSWADVRALRLPLWVRSEGALREVAERVGRAAYVASGKNPMAALLPYLALGPAKLPVLRGLFRLSPAHQKVFSFLGNDFADERWARAASKNAFALIAQHRHEQAAGFFLLAGRPGQAVKTLTMQMRDPVLALLVARLAAGNAAAAAAAGSGGGNKKPPSPAFGLLLDGQTLLREAGAALLAATKATAAPASTATTSAPVAAQAPRPAPAHRSILGFGFADDDDHYTPPPRGGAGFGGGGGDDDTTYYAPPPKAATVSVQPEASTSQPPSQQQPPLWWRVDVDDDPVGYVAQHELRAGAVLALSSWPAALLPHAAAPPALPPVPPSDADFFAGAPPSGAVAAELLATATLGRPLDALTGALSRALQLTATGSPPAAAASAVDLLRHAQLLLATQPLRAPAVRRALAARLQAATAGATGSSPAGTAAGAAGTPDWLDAALRDAMVRALLAAGAPALAVDHLAGGISGGKASSTAAAAAAPVTQKKTSLFADFDAPPPSVSASTSRGIAAEQLPTSNSGGSSSAATVLPAALSSQLCDSLVRGVLLPELEASAASAADLAVERAHLPPLPLADGQLHAPSLINRAVADELTMLRAGAAALGCSHQLLLPASPFEPAALVAAATDSAAWLAALATGPVADHAAVVRGYLDASTAAVSASCSGAGGRLRLRAATAQFTSSDRCSQLVATHARLALAGLRLHASLTHVPGAADGRTDASLVAAVAHHAWLHTALAAALAGDWRRLLALLSSGPSHGDVLSAAPDHALFAGAALEGVGASGVGYAAAAAAASRRNLLGNGALALPPLERWLSAYVDAALTVLVACALAAHSSGDDYSGAGGGYDVTPQLLRWRDDSVRRLVACRCGGVVRSPATAATNAGPRRAVIAALTGVPPSDAATSSAWWQDSATLFSLPPPTTASSTPPLVALWAWLGGPGLLWTAGTERRALARAASRAARGFLPDAPASLRLTLRPKGAGPPVWDLCASVHPVPSVASPTGGGSGGGSAATLAAAAATANGPLLLAAALDVGVGHMDVRQQQQQTVAAVAAPSTQARVALPLQTSLGAAHSAAVRLLQGHAAQSGSVGGMPPPSPGSSRNSNTIGHLPTYRKRFLGSLVGDMNAAATGAATTAGAAPEADVTSAQAPPPGARSGAPLAPSAGSSVSAGSSPARPSTAAGSAPGSGSSPGPTPVVLVHAWAEHLGSRLHSGLMAGLHRAEEAAASLSIGRGGHGTHSGASSTHTARPSLLSTTFKPPQVTAAAAAEPQPSAAGAAPPPSASKQPRAPLVPTVPPAAEAAVVQPSPVGGGSGASAPASAFFASATSPTAAALPPPPSVVDVLAVDRHEYALPFTLAPSALAHHPTLPLYARAGPEGMVAVVSLALEPAPAVSAPSAAQQLPSCYQYVHRLERVLSYTPLPGAHQHSQHHPGHQHTVVSSSNLAEAARAAVASIGGSGGSGAAARRASGTGRPLSSALFGGGSAVNLPSLAHGIAAAGGMPRSASGTGLAAAVGAPSPALSSAAPGATADVALPPTRVSPLYNLDEQVTRLRWSPDGCRLAACFASGVVRVWHTAAPGGHKRPAAVLSTSGSHSLGGSGAGDAFDGTAAAAGVIEGARPVWAATDVAFLDHAGSVVAVSAAPLFPPGVEPPPASAAAGSAVAGGSSGGGRDGGFTGVASPLPSPPSIGLPLALVGDASPASTSASTTAAAAAGFVPSPGAAAAAAASTGSTAPPVFTMQRLGSMSELLYSGWGLHLFHLSPLPPTSAATAAATGLAPVAVAARYPAFPGVTALAYDESGATLVAGCEDGGMLAVEVCGGGLARDATGSSSGLLRVTGRVPGVPMVALQQHHGHGHRAHGPHGGKHRASLATTTASDVTAVPALDDDPFATPATATFDDGDGAAPLLSDDGWGHAGSVHVLALHPSRRLLAAGGHDGDVSLWALAPRLGAASAVIRGLHAPRAFDLRGPHQSGGSDRHLARQQHQQQAAGPHGGVGGGGRASVTLPKQSPPSSGALAGVTPPPALQVPPPPQPPAAQLLARTGALPGSGAWALAAGVSALVVTEDHVISAGYDGAVLAVPQVW